MQKRFAGCRLPPSIRHAAIGAFQRSLRVTIDFAYYAAIWRRPAALLLLFYSSRAITMMSFCRCPPAQATTPYRRHAAAHGCLLPRAACQFADEQAADEEPPAFRPRLPEMPLPSFTAAATLIAKEARAEADAAPPSFLAAGAVAGMEWGCPPSPPPG